MTANQNKTREQRAHELHQSCTEYQERLRRLMAIEAQKPFDIKKLSDELMSISDDSMQCARQAYQLKITEVSGTFYALALEAMTLALSARRDLHAPRPSDFTVPVDGNLKSPLHA